MSNTNQEQTGWQTALEHHERLCVERGRTIDARFNSVDERFNSVDTRFNSIEKRLDNIERLQRFTLGAIMAWPALLIAVLKLVP